MTSYPFQELCFFPFVVQHWNDLTYVVCVRQFYSHFLFPLCEFSSAVKWLRLL